MKGVELSIGGICYLNESFSFIMRTKILLLKKSTELGFSKGSVADTSH